MYKLKNNHEEPHSRLQVSGPLYNEKLELYFIFSLYLFISPYPSLSPILCILTWRWYARAQTHSDVKYIRETVVSDSNIQRPEKQLTEARQRNVLTQSPLQNLHKLAQKKKRH